MTGGIRRSKSSAGVRWPGLGRRTLSASIALTAAACGGGPQVKATPNYTPKACEGQRVLLVPIAVSDDLGDRRTGVVLSDNARRVASEATCTQLAKSWSKGTLVCPPFDVTGKPAALSELERAFALDAPVPPTVWQTLRGGFQADYALLFRPENVSASNQVERDAPAKGDTAAAARGFTVGVAALVSPAALVGALLGGAAASERKPEATTSNRTELNYTLSATLLDMRSGNVLKVGVNQGSAKRDVPRNLGYAEPPPIAPLLEEIMVPLGERMLDD